MLDHVIFPSSVLKKLMFAAVRKWTLCGFSFQDGLNFLGKNGNIHVPGVLPKMMLFKNYSFRKFLTLKSLLQLGGELMNCKLALI